MPPVEPGNQSLDANDPAEASEVPTFGVPMSCSVGDLAPIPRTHDAEFLTTLDTHDIAPADMDRITPAGGEDIGLIAADLPEGDTDLPGLGRSNTLACGRGTNGADLSGRNAHLLQCRLCVCLSTPRIWRIRTLGMLSCRQPFGCTSGIGLVFDLSFSPLGVLRLLSQLMRPLQPSLVHQRFVTEFALSSLAARRPV